MESEQKRKITTLWALNLSPQQISEKLGIPLEEVRELIRKQSHKE